MIGQSWGLLPNPNLGDTSQSGGYIGEEFPGRRYKETRLGDQYSPSWSRWWLHTVPHLRFVYFTECNIILQKKKQPYMQYFNETT